MNEKIDAFFKRINEENAALTNKSVPQVNEESMFNIIIDYQSREIELQWGDKTITKYPINDRLMSDVADQLTDHGNRLNLLLKQIKEERGD